MKLFFIFFLILTLTTTSSVLAMKTIEEPVVTSKSKKRTKKDAEEALFKEYGDYLFDERAWNEDCISYFQGLLTEFCILSESDGEDRAVRTFTQKLHLDTNQPLTVLQIYTLLDNQVISHEEKWRLTNGLISRFNAISKKEGKPRTKLLEIFNDLFCDYTCNIQNELLKNWRNGTKEAVLNASPELHYHHQMQLQFLAKLYQVIKPSIENNDTLASIEIDKNFRDILEGKASFLTTFHSGMETNPTDDDRQKVQAYWKKKGARIPIVMCFKRPTEKRDDLLFFSRDNKRKTVIDWSRVTLTNIDDVPDQIKYFFPNITKVSLEHNLAYLEKTRRKLLAERSKKEEEKKGKKEAKKALIKVQEVSAESVEERVDLPFPETVSSPTASKKTVNINNNNNVELSPLPVIKREKDRDARRKEWERKQDGAKSAPIDEETKIDDSEPKRPLSKTTLVTLSKLFGFKHAKMITWKELVKAWKDLRKVIDGAEDPKPRKMSGSVRTFDGGPDDHSFNLHKPHGSLGDSILSKTMTRIAEHFQNKFEWTLEKLKLHGFDPE